MSRFLLTGGSGFIGTHIVESLLNSNHQVLSLDAIAPKVAKHSEYWQKVDLCDYQLLKNYVLDFNPQFVIHLAARTDLRGKNIEDYKANTEGVTNILNALELCKSLERVIFASSMYVCEPGYKPKDFEDYAPHTIYGESKVISEKLIKERNPMYSWAIIRPTSIWGPYFAEPYLDFFKIVLSRKYFHLGSRACKKTYGYVSNTTFQINSIFNSPGHKVHTKTFYLGDYKPYDISEWADEIAGLENVKIAKIPFAFFRLAGWIGDVLGAVGIKFPMTSFRLKNMTTDNIHNLDPIRYIVPELPVDRKTGTKFTIEWIKAAQQLK
jgi:nucleoside-diphosphate-sugar epimerase